MLGHFRHADGILVPLNLDEVENVVQFDDAVNILHDAFTGFTDYVERVPYQNAIRAAKRLLSARFQLLSALLRRQRRTEERINLLLGTIDAGRSLLSDLVRFVGLVEPRLALGIALLVHAREGVLFVDDLADAGH